MMLILERQRCHSLIVESLLGGGGVFGGPRMVEVVRAEWAGEFGPRPGWEGYLTRSRAGIEEICHLKHR